MRAKKKKQKVGEKEILQITGVYRPAIWHCCHGNPDLPQSQSPQCKARRDRKVKMQLGTNIQQKTNWEKREKESLISEGDFHYMENLNVKSILFSSQTTHKNRIKRLYFKPVPCDFYFYLFKQCAVKIVIGRGWLWFIM